MFRDDLAQQLCRACYGTADHCTKRPAGDGSLCSVFHPLALLRLRRVWKRPKASPERSYRTRPSP